MAVQTVTDPMLLDSTGQLILSALGDIAEAVQPTNVYLDLSVSIPVNGWSNTIPHTYTWTNEHVSDECGIEWWYGDGAEDIELDYMSAEKVAGGVKFTSDEVPGGAVPVVIRIINAKAESATDLDATEVSTSAVSGVSNVEQALSNVDGRVTTNASGISTLNTSLSNVTSTTNYTDNILVDALTTTINKVFQGSGSSYTGSVPDGPFRYGIFIVYPRFSTKIVVAYSSDCRIAVNEYTGTDWAGWQEVALSSQLTNMNTYRTYDANKTPSNYPIGLFPLYIATDTTIGNVTVSGNVRGIAYNNNNLTIHFFVCTATGDMAYFGGYYQGWHIKEIS